MYPLKFGLANSIEDKTKLIHFSRIKEFFSIENKKRKLFINWLILFSLPQTIFSWDTNGVQLKY